MDKGHKMGLKLKGNKYCHKYLPFEYNQVINVEDKYKAK